MDTAILLVTFILRYTLLLSGGVLGVVSQGAHKIAQWVEARS